MNTRAARTSTARAASRPASEFFPRVLLLPRAMNPSTALVRDAALASRLGTRTPDRTNAPGRTSLSRRALRMEIEANASGRTSLSGRSLRTEIVSRVVRHAFGDKWSELVSFQNRVTAHVI